LIVRGRSPAQSTCQTTFPTASDGYSLATSI
jgi:hypothetical protein